MRNLRETAKRIKKGVEKGEKFILFGDADLDGVTSTIMLEEAIEMLGGEKVVYLSDRERWGYGLSRAVMEEIKREKEGIVITLDCGISNFEGVDVAKEYGFEVIIVDHHTELERLPQADLILDPNQKKDDYPFKKMANAGVVYKLTQEILRDEFEKAERRFLELATLGTLADMVPNEEDNKRILERGLPLLRDPEILALRVLKEEGEDVAEKAISLLNITTPVDNVNRGYLFLREKRKERAEDALEKLKKEKEKRKLLLLKEEEAIEEEIDGREPIVFKEGNFPPHLAGAVASRVIRKAKKPVFLYSIEGDLAKGSARGVPGYDTVKAMSACSMHLVSFGGHPEASGFTLKKENTEKFKSCLIEHFNNSL